MSRANVVIHIHTRVIIEPRVRPTWRDRLFNLKRLLRIDRGGIEW